MFYKYNKPKGIYANKAIRDLGKKINTKKIGHTGILDPLASGLMIVATEEDTKLLQYIENKTKTYLAKCKFGFKSDSYDIDTEVINLNLPLVTKDEILKSIEIVKHFTEQIPPIYSAKKINGKKAYDYAREKQQINLKPQKIKIYKLELIDFSFEKQEATFYMHVSEGSYVRSILVDIAKQFNNSCVMTELKRIACGNIELNSLLEDCYEEIKIDQIIQLPKFKLNDYEKEQLKYGRRFSSKLPNGVVFALNSKNEIAAIGEIKENRFAPKKVFTERLK
ncbi:tRNA pseudouridine(55) synthase TruB [Mycoplasmopsis glycophila]|uniref:tRNA pseudouridine synthase B n=1 Tax=Mycoplasmopsis glycophila TaxID=171285 RepID=A0A449AUV8_9BACT|nr:tRNA pseudouridine(55) synthase TruB [Mycoplasmopsis glycophila]VEU70273.1 tRNA pseudouridine synthase B [Mycoplasmopsis glycophila]